MLGWLLPQACGQTLQIAHRVWCQNPPERVHPVPQKISPVPLHTGMNDRRYIYVASSFKAMSLIKCQVSPVTTEDLPQLVSSSIGI